MTNLISLKTIFADVEKKPEQQLTLFALLNLGILDSLASGTISADDALQTFFHADNCGLDHFSHNSQRFRLDYPPLANTANGNHH